MIGPRAVDYEEFPRLSLGAVRLFTDVCSCAGEPAAEHEEGRHPDAQAEAEEHGRRRGRRGRGARRSLRYVLGPLLTIT